MGNLSQVHILVTRAASQSSGFSAMLREQGAEVMEMPTIAITAPSSWEPLDGAIAQLDQFDWLILTSANAVTFLMDRLAVSGRIYTSLSNIKLAVVGAKTAAVLANCADGRQPDFTPPSFVADALVAHFPEPLAGQKILFPRVESGGRDVLVKAFLEQGAQVTEVAAYESRCPETADAGVLQALGDRQLDLVTFASSKTVRHFAKLLKQGLGESWLEVLEGVAIASIGPQTSQSCRELLGRVDLEAKEYTLEGLTGAIAAYVAARASGSFNS
jgi:uroporphyrinogen-III synthase